MPLARAYIGTSGWQYRHWGNGVFYPAGLRQSDWFKYYCNIFDCVEVNNTFYHLPKKEVFERWRDVSPDGFRFAIKASRYITHLKKLSQPEEAVTKFLENVLGLGPKISVILFQFPPFWNLDLPRLEKFIEFWQGQTLLPNVKIAFEFRHRSWHQPQVHQLLRSADIALCFSDWPELNITEPITAGFIYIRRHGPTWLYSSNYSSQQLQHDAKNVKNWLAQGMDVYVFYNNDAFGWAVQNALSLKQLVGHEVRRSE